MSPSVRGAERLKVVGLLLASGIVSGGLVGFGAGALWEATAWPASGPALTALLATAAVAADLIASRTGRLSPPAVRRQVPQLWGRMFGARVVAVLYGARLGVGPLTILTTWLWWAATLIAASHGAWAGAATGAAFHLARVVTMLVAATGAERAMSARMATVRRGEQPVAAATALAVCAWLAMLVR